ncbi:Dihydroorotate dehydrogenase [Aphelenchoides bicaudatus]|nr:Dihydroorotate dehydrogenase [Aphelenchoides bicaudatus]
MAAKSAIGPGKIIKLVAGAGSAFVVGQFVWGSERFYGEVFMPIVQRYVDAETAHRWAIKMASYGLMPRFGDNHREYSALKCEFLGLQLKNPIGIAAGFDKNGEAIKRIGEQWIGFCGNRFRYTPASTLEIQNLVCFGWSKIGYGFNSDGVGIVSERVKKNHVPGVGVPLGVNLGKNAITESAALDYEIGCNYFANHCEYLVINVSSPNTKGLRALQSKDELVKLLETAHRGLDRIVQDKKPRPKVLVKITADLSPNEKRDIAQVVTNANNKVDGLIISNTTIERTDLKSEFKSEQGGLSGAPLKDASTKCISDMYKLTDGRVPIIGCGGIESGADAYKKICAGASVVQFYTALVYQGFPAIGRIKRELNEELLKHGCTTVSAAIGSDHKNRLEDALKEGQRSWWKFWLFENESTNLRRKICHASGSFMVKEISTSVLLFKRASPYIFPLICGSIIFFDWFHTYQLKQGKKESILDKLVSPEDKKLLEERAKF